MMSDVKSHVTEDVMSQMMPHSMTFISQANIIYVQ